MTTALQPESGFDLPPQSLRAKCESQVRQMDVRRDANLPRWRDLEAFVSPFASNVDGTPRKYEDQAANVLDESIFYARATLQSFLHSGMTNPSREWSQWTLPDQDLAESESAKEWLHVTNQRRLTLLSRSNFYDTMAWVYGEWPTFATAVVLIEEDAEDVFRYVPLGIGSYSLADDAKGNCIAVARCIRMTVRQVIERFAQTPNGYDLAPLSKRVRECIRLKKLEEEIEVQHLICPNDDYAPDKQTPKHFAFASYYWEKTASIDEGLDGFLAKEGYREWPAMVFRWDRLQGDPWGTNSPGLLTLGANKSVQAMESDLLMASEKQVKPPLVMPAAASRVSILPAAITAIDTRAGQMAGPLHTVDPKAIEIIANVKQAMIERIYALWHTRMILAVTNNPYANGSQPKTAREIEEISQERLLVLGRVVESAAGAFKVGSDREFGIMARRGFLPPTPPELAGQPLAIEFTSMLAIAQKSVGLGALMDYGMSQAQMFKLTGDPAITDRTDFSEWAQAVGDRSGIPPKVQRTDEQVAARVAARAKAQAEAAQAEQAKVESEAARNLSQSPTDGDNALTRVLQGAQQGPPGAPQELVS